MGKFQIGDKVHCVVPGRYTVTDAGIECIVVKTNPFRVRLLNRIRDNGYLVNEVHFELVNPLSLDNI